MGAGFWCCAEESSPPDISAPPAALLDRALLVGSLPELQVGHCCSGSFPSALPLGQKGLGKRRLRGCICDRATGWEHQGDYWRGTTQDHVSQRWSCPLEKTQDKLINDTADQRILTAMENWDVWYLFCRHAVFVWVVHPALQQSDVFLQLLVLLQLLHQCLLVVLLCTLQPPNITVNLKHVNHL